MKKRKFLEKSLKILEKKLQKRIDDTLPEVYTETNPDKMELLVFEDDHTNCTSPTPLGSISMLKAYKAREELDCSVKEISLPWVNKLVSDCEDAYDKAMSIRESVHKPVYKSSSIDYVKMEVNDTTLEEGLDSLEEEET